MNKPVTYTPPGGEPEKKRDPVARFWLSLMRAALVIGLILYILLHLFGGFSETMKTVQADLYTRELTLPLTGTVVRDEIAIPSPATGAVRYLYADGTRVRLGAKVAAVYSGYADSTAVGSLAGTDRLIDLLAEAEENGGTTVADGVKADAAIRQSLLTLASATRRGSFADATRETETLMLSMLRRDAILGGDGGAAALLTSLKSSRSAAAASITGTSTDIYAPEAGYFYSGADDGYETRIDYTKIESMTPAAYRAAAAEVPTAGSAVARLVRRAKWYFSPHHQ